MPWLGGSLTVLALSGVEDIAAHAVLLLTLQQEAESVLAQQDDWSAKGQGSRAGQVGWVGQGFVVWMGGQGQAGVSTEHCGHLLYLAYCLSHCPLPGQPPRPQISGITLEQLGS